MSISGRATFAVAALVLAVLAGCEKPVPPAPPPPPVPTPSPTPAPTPTPVPSIPRKPLPTAKLFNGLSLDARVVSEKSSLPASQERTDAEAYKVEVTVRFRLPRAAASVEDFSKNDPTLPGVFKDFPSLLSASKVSPFFERLYALKVHQVHQEIGRLDVILSRHNFFDCETILECRNPATGRRALLTIADMDVNVDGSDGDRNVPVNGSPQFFLPQTSYRWPKQTARVNPFVAVEEKRLGAMKEELAAGKPVAARALDLREGIDLAKRRIFDLQKWSFLIAEVDPFIVLPGFMMRDKGNPFSPGTGDFALVLFGGKAYPAVVGDAGPSLKIGEASLRLCLEINARATSMIRPVSDLRVTYLVFPGTADEKPLPPDLARWRARCEQYANEIGGLNVAIHSWPDIVKPWPTPTPAPTPEPTPEPAPEGLPTPAPSPMSAPPDPADKSPAPGN